MQKHIPTTLRITGVALIIIGMVAAFYGPYEMFVFYLFSKGGRFYYEGFGMGSLWYAAQVVQIVGYYFIAALFLPVGFGHLKLRRWALTLTRLYAWFWLGAGILLVGNIIALIPPLIRLDTDALFPFLQLPAIGVFLFTILILLPVLVLWFYRSRWVTEAFETHDPKSYWTEKYPFPLLALLLSFVIMIIVLHITPCLQGLFPFFGEFLLMRPAARIIALCFLILGFLIFGTVKLNKWAWWGSLAFVSFLTISSIISFIRYDFYDLMLMLNLPVAEMAYIDRMTSLHDFHLVGLVSPPLLIALGLIIYSKRYY